MGQIFCQYYLVTNPGQNKIELRRRTPDRSEGALIDAWQALPRQYGIIKAAAKEIRDTLNDTNLAIKEKTAKIKRLQAVILRYQYPRT